MKLRIEQDLSPESPREWSNLGTMICFHRRYNLGDKHDYSSSEFDGWSDMRNKISKEYDGVILPLYLYDHSGVTMSTKPFHCPWDSGQVGYICVSKDTIRKEYGVKRITQELLDCVESILIGEVKTYDQYITGNVYGYEIVDDDGDVVDSCWGYYGYEYAEEEGKAQLEYYKSQVPVQL